MSGFRLREATRRLRAGAVVAYPTEAVWGLGCDPLNPEAVARILRLKGRPMRKGLILNAADFAQLRPFVCPVADDRMAAILATWPGPHTWLLPAAPHCPAWLTGNHDTLAVRVTAHPVAAALCRAAAMPLVSTRATRSGRPPARTALPVRLRCGPAVDLILPGATGSLRRPTPIRDGRSNRLLRDG